MGGGDKGTKRYPVAFCQKWCCAFYLARARNCVHSNRGRNRSRGDKVTTGLVSLKLVIRISSMGGRGKGGSSFRYVDTKVTDTFFTLHRYEGHRFRFNLW